MVLHITVWSVVGCLALAFVLREWGKEIAFTVPLLLIMLYIAKDSTNDGDATSYKTNP